MIADPTRIDLWCTFPRNISDANLLQTYHSLLSDDEKKQQRRFHFAKDQHRYLVTRALVRTVLSRYTSIPAEQLVFAENEFGKPHLIGINDPIEFNVTHSDNLVLIGVTRSAALGIDTENSQDRTISRELAEYSFAPDEVADFLAQPIEHQQQRFFEFWTLKESYIKARGMGLSIPLQQFSFQLSKEIGLTIDPRQNDQPERWRFWQFQLTNEYLIAICAEDIGAEPAIGLKEVVPLVCEKKLEFQHRLYSAS